VEAAKANDLPLGFLQARVSALSCQAEQLPTTTWRFVAVIFQPGGGQLMLRVHTRAACSEGMWRWIAEAESQ
jgi:hypothetical protein